MTNKETIELFLELSAGCGVPPLFMSRPGLGKTSIVEAYCKSKGYLFVPLIGSRFTPEEIGGYQVNDATSNTLVVKWPQWYKNVMDAHAKGQRALIFVDELNQASPYVQGALLELTCSRRITCGNLPEDTIIAAAANYKENIGPSAEDIIAPQANRFILVALTKDIGDMWNAVPIEEERGFTPKKAIAKIDLNSLYGVISTYQSSAEPLAKNREIQCFDEEEVYGYTSQRSVAYFKRAITWCQDNAWEIGAVQLIAKGLIGGGQGVNPAEMWKGLRQQIKEWWITAANTTKGTGSAKAGVLRTFKDMNITIDSDFERIATKNVIYGSDVEKEDANWMLAACGLNDCPIPNAKVVIVSDGTDYSFAVKTVNGKLFGYYAPLQQMTPVRSVLLNETWKAI